MTMVSETIRYLVENADMLSKKPKHLRQVEYVKNENYPTGAFRVHNTRFAGYALEDEFTAHNIKEAIIGLGLEKFVDYDRASGWLTIYSV